MELKNGDRWGWVANGRWAKSHGNTPQPKLETGLPISDISPPSQTIQAAEHAVRQPPPTRPSDPPKESRKVKTFREKVAKFIEEARAGAKLLTVAPSLDEIKAKSVQITDLYTHLPDVPPEIDSTGDVAKKLKTTMGSFAVAEFDLKLSNQAERSMTGAELLDFMKKTHDECHKIADEVNRIADEIESKASLN
jgi:hypothetical protein